MGALCRILESVIQHFSHSLWKMVRDVNIHVLEANFYNTTPFLTGLSTFPFNKLIFVHVCVLQKLNPKALALFCSATPMQASGNAVLKWSEVPAG
jgi:hypothetical protein